MKDLLAGSRRCAGRRNRSAGAWLLAFAGLAMPAWAQQAQGLPVPPAASIHPWQAPPPQRAAQAYFVNLGQDDKIETPFLLKFGLSGGWGLAPISAPIGGRSGHHHLLINRELPLDFKQPLPFNDQYIHFGKGQMETVLNLPPGKYNLRLLLADDKHLPHFVYSKPLAITVVKKNSVDPATLVRKGLSLGLAGDAVKVPFRVQFHASGLNVGHAMQQLKDSGHFKLTVTPTKGPAAVMEFSNGQTEVWLSPPPGEYQLALEFIDNAQPGRALAEPVGRPVRVLP